MGSIPTGLVYFKGAVMLTVLVDEEYGYRNWVWQAPDNAKELISDAISDEYFFASNLPTQFTEGTWTEIPYEEYKERFDSEQWDLHAMLHTYEDSMVYSIEDHKHWIELEFLDWYLGDK